MNTSKLDVLFLALVLVCLAGCMSATATRTNKDGSTSSIKVSALLSDLTGGSYTSTNSDGTSTTLSIANGTPDEQAIATLANGVVNVATLFATKAPTNTVSILTNNNSGIIVINPAK